MRQREGGIMQKVNKTRVPVPGIPAGERTAYSAYKEIMEGG